MGGLVSTPALDEALRDYEEGLGLRLVERGTLDASLAASWGCPGSAGSRIATLQPEDGSECFIRLVEEPAVPGFAPMRTYGWAAFEITVEDVFQLARDIEGHGFELVGAPKEIPELPFFVPMQVTGRGSEMLYLNQVRMDTPDSDLPKASSGTGAIFIAVLAAPDRPASVRWYEESLRLTNAADYTLAYDLINQAFDLPPERTSTISLIQNGRMPIVEIDDYPPGALPRPARPGRLPPGNALVSLAVREIDPLAADLISGPARRDGPLYRGSRTATMRGSAGELIELVEIECS
jgi:catechol 2,3-dioxygenase-like lactoylglutathione lyase family enzyme